ncbi:MAG: hypothetical protein SFX73_29655 [Kofleriaceae bacterium]|nr:hypothetical protein [Kofleriaceae bacterium]
MRNEREIATEIEARRSNLEHDLGQLRSLVDDKLDVVRHARDQLEQRRRQITEMRDNASMKISERPIAAVGAAFVAGALLGLMRGR